MHRFRSGLGELFFALAALFFLAGVLALGFPQLLSPENRAQVILASSLVLISCFTTLAWIQIYRRQRRAREWRKVMITWKKKKEAGEIPDNDLAGHLSEGALEYLAAHIYAQIGYRVYPAYCDGECGYKYKLLNPEGQMELLLCKQSSEPLGLREVSHFHAAMIREHAIQGFIWAPGGFSSAAIYWTKGKPILLADSTEISRLVESTFQQIPGEAGTARWPDF